MKGLRLSEVSWEKAAELALESYVVLLPVGAGTKEHGPHLPLGTDMFLAEELANRLMEQASVLVLPTLAYAYYPAFMDWPGSVSLEAEHFMAVVRDILISFHRHGFQKFLILDTGISTHAPMRILSSDLYNQFGIRVAVTNAAALLEDIEYELAEQEHGGHADEMETSMMLQIRPDLVNMAKAVQEYRPGKSLVSRSGQPKVVMGGKMDTKSGIHGDATLANRQKGQKTLDAMTRDLVEFVERFLQMA